MRKTKTTISPRFLSIFFVYLPSTGQNSLTHPILLFLFLLYFYLYRCENCRYSAPTLYQVEELYKDQVNFVMVNADDPKSWPLIEKLGVDAIPHLSLLEADGTVDTALIGPVPKQWLIQDIDVLLNNAATTASTTTTATTDAATATTTTSRQPLPHQMLDVFANKPSEQRKILIDMDE